MTIRCPGCNAEQQRPTAQAERPLCMRCGESLAPALAKASPASTPAGAEGEFTARTMSMVRPSLTNIESLPALSELVAQAAAEAQAAPPPAQHKQWHVRTGAGAQFGPLAADEVQRWLAEGRLDAGTIAWRPGQVDWQPLAQAMGLQSQAEAPPVPARAAVGESHNAEPSPRESAASASFLAPANGGDATSASSRPTLMHATLPRRWPWLAAASAIAAVLALAGVWLVKSLRAPIAQEAAVVSDVPTPAAAPVAPPTEAPSPTPSAAEEPEGDRMGEEAPPPKTNKHKGAHGRRHKRRGHRHAPRE